MGELGLTRERSGFTTFGKGLIAKNPYQSRDSSVTVKRHYIPGQGDGT